MEGLRSYSGTEKKEKKKKRTEKQHIWIRSRLYLHVWWIDLGWPQVSAKLLSYSLSRIGKENTTEKFTG